MAPTPPSTPVRFGLGLTTVVLVLTVLFGIFMVVSVIVGVARDGQSLLFANTVPVAVQISPDALGPLPADLRFSSGLDVTLEVHNPSTKVMLLRSAMEFGAGLLAIAGLWLLRGFLQSVARGDPFGARNVRRLRTLGFLLVVGAPIVEVVNYSLREALFVSIPPVPEFNIGIAGPMLPLAALLGGLAAFILAEVFAFGMRLREDAEATI